MSSPGPTLQGKERLGKTQQTKRGSASGRGSSQEGVSLGRNLRTPTPSTASGASPASGSGAALPDHMRVAQFAKAIGVGRSTVFKWLAEDRLRRRKIGGITFVVTQSWNDMIADKRPYHRGRKGRDER